MPVTTITPAPFIIKDATVQLGNSDYTAAVSSATLTPSSTVKTFRGLVPTANWANVTNATWMLDLNFAQSLGATDLLGYLYANEGTSIPFTVKPDNGKGASWSGTVILTPAAIGGAGDDYATSSVSLPVQGKPTFVPAA